MAPFYPFIVFSFRRFFSPFILLAYFFVRSLTHPLIASFIAHYARLLLSYWRTLDFIIVDNFSEDIRYRQCILFMRCTFFSVYFFSFKWFPIAFPLALLCSIFRHSHFVNRNTNTRFVCFYVYLLTLKNGERSIMMQFSVGKAMQLCKTRRRRKKSLRIELWNLMK